MVAMDASDGDTLLPRLVTHVRDEGVEGAGTKQDRDALAFPDGKRGGDDVTVGVTDDGVPTIQDPER